MSDCALGQVELGTTSWEEWDVSVTMVGVFINVLFRQCISIYIKLGWECQLFIRDVFILVAQDV